VRSAVAFVALSSCGARICRRSDCKRPNWARPTRAANLSAAGLSYLRESFKRSLFPRPPFSSKEPPDGVGALLIAARQNDGAAASTRRLAGVEWLLEFPKGVRSATGGFQCCRIAVDGPPPAVGKAMIAGGFARPSLGAR